MVLVLENVYTPIFQSGFIVVLHQRCGHGVNIGSSYGPLISAKYPWTRRNSETGVKLNFTKKENRGGRKTGIRSKLPPSNDPHGPLFVNMPSIGTGSEADGSRCSNLCDLNSPLSELPGALLSFKFTQESIADKGLHF